MSPGDGPYDPTDTPSFPPKGWQPGDPVSVDSPAHCFLCLNDTGELVEATATIRKGDREYRVCKSHVGVMSAKKTVGEAVAALRGDRKRWEKT